MSLKGRKMIKKKVVEMKVTKNLMKMNNIQKFMGHGGCTQDMSNKSLIDFSPALHY